MAQKQLLPHCGATGLGIKPHPLLPGQWCPTGLPCRLRLGSLRLGRRQGGGCFSADLLGKEKGEAVSCRSKKPSLLEQQKGSVFASLTRKARAVFSSRHLAPSRLDEVWEYFCSGMVFAFFASRSCGARAKSRGSWLSAEQITAAPRAHPALAATAKPRWQRPRQRGSAQGSLLGEEQEKGKKKKALNKSLG